MTSPDLKTGVDAVAYVAVASSWTDYLPHIVTILTGLWIALRMIDWLTQGGLLRYIRRLFKP